VRLNSLFNTATFRLALSFASLFAVSSAVLFAIVYWSIQEFESQQIRRSIATEMGSLELSAKSERPGALVHEIEERTKSPGHHPFEYGLLDASGTLIAGDLNSPPTQLGWQVLDRPGATMSDGDTSVVFYVFGMEAGDGQKLFVAQDTEPLEELRETVAGTFALGGAITVALAVLGGAAISALFMYRVERINRTARSVMAGAIGERMPVSGANDEFDQLSTNLNLMLDRIESLVGNLKRVSSDVAHDLRTPLTHLRHGLERARSEARTVPEFSAVIERSISETDGILRTFSALLRIAEIESGAQRASFADVDLSGLMTRMLETYAPVAEDEGYVLSGSIEPGVAVRGDRALLNQLLANLCENAIHHTPAGTRIELGLEANGSEIVCSVKDTGPGIPRSERARVFQPFHRLDQSRSTPGSGLGLALVKAISELHGGTIVLLDNAPGATLELRLPRRSQLQRVEASVATGRSGLADEVSRQLSGNL